MPMFTVYMWWCQCFHQGGDCEIMCDEKLVLIEIGMQSDYWNL
jgi:hypothetical protein